MISNKTLEYSKRITTALLGVDFLYRMEREDEPGDRDEATNKNDDGLIVVNMDTAKEFSPERFQSYSVARECFEQLRKEAAGLPEKDRQRYYDQLCHSTLAFILWRTETIPFFSQLKDFLHVPVQPASETELETLKTEMQAILDNMGYHGDFKEQCAEWEIRNRIVPDDISGLYQDLMDEAWNRTEKYLFKIPASKSDGMQLVPVSGAAFNARCNYLERKIELNTDPTLTRPGLKHLVVHEGCPGHYLQFKLRESLYQAGDAPADVLLSVVNTASSSVFEGIADMGIEMVNWLETDDDRFLSLINRYRAGIGTVAAWQMHALGWSAEHVYDWLLSQSLIGGEGWTKSRIDFISAPSRAVLIWSYWWGEQVLAPIWQHMPIKHRSSFLRFLYGRMHSNKTVAMFHNRAYYDRNV